MDPMLPLAALDGAGTGILITDRTGKIGWVNTEFARVTGYTRDELLGQSTEVLKAGALDPSFYRDLGRATQSGSAWEGEMVGRRKDGSLQTAELSISPVFGEDALGADRRQGPREVTHYVVIQRDITARRSTEEALRRSQEQYRSLVEDLGEGIVSLDRQQRIQLTNPAADNILGMPRGTLVGRLFNDFVDPLDLPVLEREMSRRARGEKSCYELRLIRPSGECRTVRITATPHFDAQGQVQSSLGVIHDITEEKRLLQRLKLLANTVDSIDECVSICDPEDRLLFVNRAFLRTYGFEEFELLGEHISIIRSPLNPEEITGGILAATLAGGWRGELWNRNKNGNDFLVMLNTAAVTDGNGVLEATVGVARDITERKREEAELTRAKERAESASRAKSQFLAVMSHEIRTPMNGVIGMTGLLLDTQLTPEQRDYAETVRKSGDALLTVINDILDFSKIEAGKVQIEYSSFDLRVVIEEIDELLAPQVEEKHLEFLLEYPSNLPRHFVGDAGRVRQVVTNLVGNAIKFTPRGCVRVTVECAGQDAQAAQMRISVHDTGVGIPPEKLDSLFEKFSQVDASITRSYGGTGLGLAIARQLTELMGGTIAVTSRLGEGSVFSATLPLRRDAEPRAGNEAAELRGLRVLVVDDREANRRVLSDLIANWGMASGSASSGEEAQEALRAAQGRGEGYHFVLVDYRRADYRKAGVDGAGLAAAIRADRALGETAVVMLSTVGQGAEVRQLEGTLIDAWLVKPVRQSQLLSTLASVEGKRSKTGVGCGNGDRTARWAGSFAGLGLRVLVAEDNAVNQKVAVRMLEKLGLRTDLASNGREAVELCEMLPYDLILMDCQMPEMDGHAATREIRRHEHGSRRTAIVAMTADAMGGAREDCIQAGMDDYVVKPVRFEDLMEALRKWLPTGV